jgi:hypothetical protein
MFGDFQQQKLGFHQQSLGFPSANFRTQQSKVMLSGCDWYWFLFFVYGDLPLWGVGCCGCQTMIHRYFWI